jgi:hypothetical protein
MTDKNEVRIDNNPDKILKDVTKKLKKNPWMVSTVILAIVAIILLVTNGGIGSGVSSEVAGQKLVDFAASQGAEASLVEVNEKSGFYEVVLSMQGQELPLYVTKDGKYFTQALVPLEAQDNPPAQQQPPADVPKSDKPKVELFVMTHCTYGTQAEKGMLPVYGLLGDKIDSSVKFVHYFLHEGPKQEPYETPIQICIREEQGAKYTDYLTCYLEDGDSDRCLTETNIDTAKLDTCVAGKADDYYAADSALSEGYGVRGSPTLIINGEIAQSGRSPSAYLATICNAFTEGNVPEECSEELNSASPSPGFGYTASAGGSTQAQC